MLSIVAETEFVAENTMVFAPAETLAADVRLAVGVEEVLVVYVQTLVLVFTGPSNRIVKVVPSAAAGISREIVFDKQQETIFTGYIDYPEVIETANLTPSILDGQPPPLAILTIPPEVEPPVDQLLVPAPHSTPQALKLVPPTEFLTVTSQFPDQVAGVRSKVTEVAVADYGMNVVVCLVIVCLNATSAKLFPSTRLVPVSVMVFVLDPVTFGLDEEIEVRDGDEAVSIYVKSQLLIHLLRITNLVAATT